MYGDSEPEKIAVRRVVPSVEVASQPEVSEGSTLDQTVADTPHYDQPPTPTPRISRHISWRRMIGFALITIGILAGGLLMFHSIAVNKQQSKLSTSLSDLSARIKPQDIPLSGISQQLSSQSSQSIPTLTVNGQENVTSSLVMSPTSQPSSAVAGQIYYNQTSNLLSYYNGTTFVGLQGGGNVTNNITNNAAPVTNTTINNVTNGGGGGNTSSTGTPGTLALFTAANTLGDSLITQAGTTVNVGGTTDNVGSSGGNETVSLGSLVGTSTTNVQAGTGNLNVLTGSTVGSSGNITIQSGDSSTTTAGNVSIDTGNSIINGTIIADKDFESGVDNMGDSIFGDNSTIVQSNAEAHGGTHSLAVTVGSNFFPQWGISDGIGNPPMIIPVTAGHTYVFSAWVRAATTSCTITAGVTWSSDGYYGGGIISQQDFGTVTDISSGWRHVTGVLTAPAGANVMGFYFNSFDATSIGEVHYFDDITATDLSSSSSSASLNIGATNAQLITIGNSAMLAPTSIYGGGVNIAAGNGIMNLSATTLTASAGGASLTTTSGALDLTAANSSTWKIGNSGGAGGNLTIASGNAGGNNNGGNLVLQTGSGAGTGAAGDIVLGNDGTPTALTVRGGAAAGDNIVGSNLTFAASNGTGVGGSGDIIFNTAGGISDPLVTHDASSGAEEGASNATLSWTHTVGAESNMILLVAVDTASINNPSSATGVTYDGLALTELANVNPGQNLASEANGSVWYLVNPPTGAHTVQVSLAGNPSDVGASASSFYNVDPSNPIATFTKNQVEEGLFISTTLPGTNAGEGIFDALFARASIANITPGIGQTQIYGQGFFGDANDGSFRQGVAGSTTDTWSGSSGGGPLGEVLVALSPPPNVTPDTLGESFRITQSGTLGVDLTSNEVAANTLSFGGTSDRSIVVNQNPASADGHSLTIQAGDAGVGGNNNGGNLKLQGGAANGSGTGGGVIVQPQTDTLSAFEIQNSTSTPLLSADTVNMVLTVAGTGATYATLTLTNAHFSSSQSTPPTIGLSTCNGTPAVTAGSTDSAGSFTTGSLTTGGNCVVTLTFNKPYASAPKSVLITPMNAAAADTSPSGPQPYISSTSVNNFVTTFNTSVGTGATYKYYYWVIE